MFVLIKVDPNYYLYIDMAGLVFKHSENLMKAGQTNAIIWQLNQVKVRVIFGTADMSAHAAVMVRQRDYVLVPFKKQFTHVWAEK